MGFALLVALAAGGLYLLDQRAAQGGPGPGPGGGPPPPPPPPPPVLPPGLYVAGTPGAIPIQVMVMGGDGFGMVTANPGGFLDPAMSQTSATFWYGPGTSVTFKADVTGWPASIGTAFDHFDGPGVSTKQNPFTIKVTGAGYVRGVFATFGFIGS